MRVRKNRQRLLWLGVSLLGTLTLSSAAHGQSSADSQVTDPLVTDWSHQHVIFSTPRNAEQAKRLQRDARYRQQLRRHSSLRWSVGETASVLDSESQFGVSTGDDLQIGRDWSQDMGSGASVGAYNYPAKYSLRGTTANCGSAAQPDFVVYGTGLMGSSRQASIVAYDNIYSGCGGTVPKVYWAYNTGGTVNTSPVLSSDGTQVAFVETNSRGEALLVLIRWAASTTETITSPQTLTRLTNLQYFGCAAPCMTTATLKNASGIVLNSDTYSSVFYDYNNDIAYVGDDSGWLHQFGTVFKAVPGEVTSAGWPVQVNPSFPHRSHQPGL